MIMKGITPAPPDAILGLTETFKADPRPGKINLGVGVYQDDTGATPVLASVKTAEQRIWEKETTKSYLPISGAQEYKSHVQQMILGADHPALRAGRVRTAHTPGGTGALRVSAEILRQWRPEATVWMSDPTWANHPGIYSGAGFKTQVYPYYDSASRGLKLDALMAALENIPSGDVVLFHVCCHNPTGVDLTDAQWLEIGRLAASKGWTPLLDFAYQGFGEDLEKDRSGLRIIADAVPELFVSSSFSKNFGLYRERTGALSLIAEDDQSASASFSHLERTIRVLYSNPPAHGGSIVTTILDDAGLRHQWELELTGMRDRIQSVRAALVRELAGLGVERDFSFIERQRGMFSFSGLTDAQVAFLREEKGIYIVKGGRINVAGITSKNLPYLVESMAEALKLNA